MDDAALGGRDAGQALALGADLEPAGVLALEGCRIELASASERDEEDCESAPCTKRTVTPHLAASTSLRPTRLERSMRDTDIWMTDRRPLRLRSQGALRAQGRRRTVRLLEGAADEALELVELAEVAVGLAVDRTTRLSEVGLLDDRVGASPRCGLGRRSARPRQPAPWERGAVFGRSRSGRRRCGSGFGLVGRRRRDRRCQTERERSDQDT